MNLESIVKGITEVYNGSEVKVQQIIKLTWWDDKNYTDEVIASVIDITEYTLRHAREVILKRVAKAVEYYMRYDKAFILNYHKIQDNSVSCDEDVGIDDFFNVNYQAETHEIDNSNVEDVIFFNELEAVIERVATEKEHNLFLLLSNGISFEKAGSIFGVKSQRAKQMLNQLLDKILH